MDALKIDYLPELRSPIMLAAFAGWNDAAEVATGALNHIINDWNASAFASIDPEEFYDFTDQRPLVRMVSPHERRIEWPANVFHAHTAPDQPHDFILLVGVEPHLRWRTFTSAVLDVADRCGVSTLVCVGGLLAEVTHTRPPRISGSGNTPELLERVRGLGIEGSRYEGPTGILGVLSDAALRQKLPAASIWGQVPHYLSSTPNPQVLLALLRRLNELLDLQLNLKASELDARRFAVQVEAALKSDPQAASYVRQLEDQAIDAPADGADSAADEALPTGDAVVRELEEFLRRRRAQGSGTDDE